MVSHGISKMIVDIQIFSDNLNGIILLLNTIELRVDLDEALIIEELFALLVRTRLFG